MTFLAVLLCSFAIAQASGGEPILPHDALASPIVIAATPQNSVAWGLPANVARDEVVQWRLRCTTSVKPANIWDFGVQWRIGRAVAQGEVLVLRFRARTVSAKTESGAGIILPFFERSAPPFKKSLEKKMEPSREWREYVIPFKAVEAYGADESAIGFHLGFQEQTIELANLTLDSFGTDFDIRQIADTVPKYRGIEPDAAWRDAARERIEKIRKGDLQIRVVDESGSPVSGAAVEVRMKRHAFGWGSAVVASRILQQGADGDRYREVIEQCFNRVVFENDLKFWAWQDLQRRERVFAASDWLRERCIEIRGHCLVWPSWRNSPKHLKDWASEPEKIRDYFHEHIRDEVTAMRGRLVDWDVVNEPYDNNDITKLLGGDEAIAEWFRLARECDPAARLYLNDYGILSAEGLDTAHHDALESLLRFLIENKVPLDGIGLQSHFGNEPTPPDRMLAILDRFGKLGLPITITEHDTDNEDESLQADFTRDFLTTVFSHPSVDAVLTWGFWERAHWRPAAAYYRADWSPKPAGQVWLDLVMRDWWTNHDAKTAADGTITLRGFCGDYAITARRGDKSKTVECAIPKEGTQVEIVVAP